MTAPRVEILYFEGCPNHAGTRALVARVARELGTKPRIELVEVPDAAAATRLRFLGSPTVRIDGQDVEPGADKRHDFVVACRVYRTKQGFSGQPAEAWIREALGSD